MSDTVKRAMELIDSVENGDAVNHPKHYNVHPRSRNLEAFPMSDQRLCPQVDRDAHQALKPLSELLEQLMKLDLAEPLAILVNNRRYAVKDVIIDNDGSPIAVLYGANCIPKIQLVRL